MLLLLCSKCSCFFLLCSCHFAFYCFYHSFNQAFRPSIYNGEFCESRAFSASAETICCKIYYIFCCCSLLLLFLLFLQLCFFFIFSFIPAEGLTTFNRPQRLFRKVLALKLILSQFDALFRILKFAASL